MGHRLETERLVLRHLTLDDAELMLALWNDPDFIRYVGDREIRTMEEARDTLEDGALAMYDDLGYGPYRVTLKSTDEDIGTCGLFKREIFDEPDLGFGLLPPHRQSGFAYEASLAVLDYAHRGLGLNRLIAIVSPENAASVRLLEKLGLHYERDVRMPDDDHDVALYAIEWPS